MISLIIDTAGGANFEGYHLRNVGSLHVGGGGLPAPRTFKVTGTTEFTDDIYFDSELIGEPEIFGQVDGMVTRFSNEQDNAYLFLAAATNFGTTATREDKWAFQWRGRPAGANHYLQVIDKISGNESARFINSALALPSGNRLYMDGGNDTYLLENAANSLRAIVGGGVGFTVDTNGMQIEATKKFFFDGGNDTYIYESAANVLTTVVGGTTRTTLNATSIALDSSIDLILAATKRAYLDGGGDSYIYESAANTVGIVTGGTASLVLLSTSIQIPATNRLYFDGGGDTYIHEASANNLQVVTGGVSALSVTSTVLTTVGDVTLPATKKLFLDGGGDTYIHESSANIVQIVAAGVGAAILSSTAMSVSGDLVIPSTKRFYVDGGTDSYIHHPSNDVLAVVLNNITRASFTTVALTLDSTLDLNVASTKRVFLDGGTDTYIYESAANTITAVTGGTDSLVLTSTKATFVGEIEIDGAFNHDGATFGAFGTAPAVKQSLAVSTLDGTLPTLENLFDQLANRLSTYGLLTLT